VRCITALYGAVRRRIRYESACICLAGAVRSPGLTGFDGLRHLGCQTDVDDDDDDYDDVCAGVGDAAAAAAAADVPAAVRRREVLSAVCTCTLFRGSHATGPPVSAATRQS